MFEGNVWRLNAWRLLVLHTILSYKALRLDSEVMVSQALCVPLLVFCSVVAGILLVGLGFLFRDYKFTASRIQILELHSQSENQG